MTRYMCPARIDERGGQTGGEVMVQRYCDFRRDGYTCIALRYEGERAQGLVYRGEPTAPVLKAIKE